jgi:hypothetical protein
MNDERIDYTSITVYALTDCGDGDVYILFDLKEALHWLKTLNSGRFKHYRYLQALTL